MTITADRVKESTLTTGGGNVTLAGAATGYRSFNAAFATGPSFYYAIVGASEWEVGIGRLVSAAVLARDTVLSSSSAGVAVVFSAGSKSVFSTLPGAALNQLLDDGLTADSLASAASNFAAIQARLDARGEVRLTRAGLYYISAVLSIPSNTHVYVGAGVTLKIADGSPSAIFTNTSARNAGVAVLGANATFGAAPDGNNYVVSITNMAGQGVLFPVGSYVSAVVLGHGALGAAGSAAAGRGYRGVNLVVESSANSIKYEIDTLYPGSAPSSNNLTLFPANANISICGLGTLDGNGQSADQSFNTGDPRGCVIWMRHAYNVLIRGPKFKRGVTWTVGSNYVRRYRVSDLDFDLRSGSGYASIDAVHLSGQHQDVIVSDCSGNSADNFVGMTIDCTEGTAYNFPYQSPGDMYDITIRRSGGNCTSALGSFGIIAMYGPAAYRYHDVTIQEVLGQGSSGVQLSTYAPTNQNQLTIGRLSIDGVSSRAVNGAGVQFTGGAVSIDSMVVRGLRVGREDVPAFVLSDATTGTIRTLELSDIKFSPYDGSTYTRTAPMVRLGGVNINSFSVRNMENVEMALNTQLVAKSGAGNLGKVSIVDVSAAGSGTGAVWINSGGGSVPAVQYTRSRYNGVAL